MKRNGLKRFLSVPYYQVALPVLRRMNFARPSAFDWAAYYLEQRNIQVKGIIDIGAADGTISMHMADLFPAATIFAFEPVPASFASLQSAAQRQPRIKPFALAVSDVNEQTFLNVNRSPFTSSLLSVRNSSDMAAVLGSGGETLERVPCTTVRLDDFLHEYPNFDTQLLKTDTQGLDLRVLRGAVRTLQASIQAVIAEFRFFEEAYQDDTSLLNTLDEYLSQLGFRLVAIQGVSPQPVSGRAFEADGLWIRSR